MDSIAFPSPAHHTLGNRRTPLRLIADERQPDYDGDPVRPERQEQRGTFRMIPDCVFDLGKSDATQLYGTMLRLARSKDYCTASAVDLAKLAKLSDRQVRNMVALLTEKGMIRVEQRHVDGMKLPNTYHLIAHLIETETPDTSDRNHVPNDRNDVPFSTERSSYPSERGSDHVKKHVNEKHVEKRILPPRPPQKQTTRADEVACWYANRIGGSPPGPASRESQHAKTLAESGITDDELGQLFDWLMAQKWVRSISLRLMADKQNEWRSTRLALPTSAVVAHDPAAFTEHFNKLRRLRSRLFDAFEFETYVTAPDGEARYQADLVKYTALVEGAEGRA